ncbi:MAG TPA: hypothetical protein VJ824_10860 [Bacillota bacterium]|nr:hypothetical protein [Bacillota bacterium]
MNPIHYHMKKWQARSNHAKILLMICLCGLAAIAIVVLWHLIGGQIPWGIQTWVKIFILCIADLLFLISALSSYSNYSFLYSYYLSKWIKENSPQDLELVTGTVLYSQSHHIPYAGHFQRITLRLLSGDVRTYYVKPSNLGSFEVRSHVRLLTHQLFIVDIYPTLIALVS